MSFAVRALGGLVDYSKYLYQVSLSIPGVVFSLVSNIYLSSPARDILREGESLQGRVFVPEDPAVVDCRESSVSVETQSASMETEAPIEDETVDVSLSAPVFDFDTDPLTSQVIKRSQYYFNLSSCFNDGCVLGCRAFSFIRTQFSEHAISIIDSLDQREITVVSYGAGGLLQDFQMLLKFKPEYNKVIRYVVIDPLYEKDAGAIRSLKSFATLCQDLCQRSSGKMVIQVRAYKSVKDYEMECRAARESRADLIIDCDTVLFDDQKIAQAGSDYRILCRTLKPGGDFLSLNDGGRAFLSAGYFSGRTFNFHEISDIYFQTHGIPRMFHLKKAEKMELISLLELNPAEKVMEPV